MPNDDEVRQIVPWFEMAFKRLVGTGVCLERGKQYLIVFKQRFTVSEVDDLQDYLTTIEEQHQCGFLILHGYGEEPTIYELMGDMNKAWDAVYPDRERPQKPQIFEVAPRRKILVSPE